jgi:anaerobic magnesium-protoporphyrin IX monomethyl ester cyclase
MRVLLTHGYFLAEDAKEQQLMRPYPPLGILYLAAYLDERGIAATVFDTTFASRSALEKHLVANRPEVVGIYTNLMTKKGVLGIVRFIRERLPGTRVVLGGPEVTHHADKFLEHGADVIIVGEGEETMTAVVEAWDKGTPLSAVDGIVFRDQSGVVRTPKRALLRSLDELPMPKRDALDLMPYLRAWREKHGTSAINISTMRGCPYTCRWCSRAVYGGTYRRRSPRLVVDEIQQIVARYQPDSLWFVDDVFTIAHGWLEELTIELERRDLRIRYECITRADRMNERVAALLKRSGCFRVWIGAESGSQKILDAMDRRVKVEQVGDMIRLCKRMGIETGTFIMLGYPGETEADIDATIDHLKRSDPDHFTITVAYPIKGTPFWEDVRDDIVDARPWEETTDREVKLRRPHSDLYYQCAVARVVNEVRSYQLARKAGGRPTFLEARHRVQAIVAGAGMRAAPVLSRLQARATGFLRPAKPPPASPPAPPPAQVIPLRRPGPRPQP